MCGTSVVKFTSFPVSLTAEYVYGRSASGSHVGVVFPITQETSTSFYVNTTHIDNTTQAVILAAAYNTSCEYHSVQCVKLQLDPVNSKKNIIVVFVQIHTTNVDNSNNS